jgi:hypothetical protein
MRIADYYQQGKSMGDIKKSVVENRLRYCSIEAKGDGSREGSLNDRAESPPAGKIFHTNEKHLKVEYIDQHKAVTLMKSIKQQRQRTELRE